MISNSLFAEELAKKKGLHCFTLSGNGLISAISCKGDSIGAASCLPSGPTSTSTRSSGDWEEIDTGGEACWKEIDTSGDAGWGKIDTSP